MPELTTDFQSLPEEYQHVIQLAQETYKITVAPLQLLVGGWSGAVVYLVSVSSNETQRVEHCILKLDRKSKSAKSDEVARHNIVLSKSTSEFARNHIAELVFDCVEHEGAIAIFYRIAGQSLLKYRPLSNYGRQNQLKTILTQTNTVLLTEWNANPTFEQAIHPQKLLEKWLGYRLNAGGTIERFLQDICQVNPDIAGLLINGQVFPNPLLYARKPEPWGKARSIDIATGLIHGDLNTNNILVRFSENKEKLQGYYIIDFALFKENTPLLYDQRYLEMSYLLHAMSEVSFAKCVNLLTLMSEVDILDSYKAPIELSGVSAVTGSARTAFSKWIQANHPSLLDDLWGQYWLAGVAAGLNFCHKRGRSDEQRLAGLIYAAANLKRYAATFKLPLPTNVELLYDETQTGANKSVSGSSHNTYKQNLPSGTVTFLFTDIEGSTKLSQQYPDAMPRMLARHHEILNECIKTHGGYVFQIVGDSFAVAFHSAIDALNAALAAQQSLHNEAWSPTPIKVRMGIHTGTAQLNDASAPTVYSGYATIALTQRIMSAGHGGQILLSGATCELVRDAIPADSELQDMGEKRLKDSLHPEHLYQLNIAGLPSTFPPLKTPDSFLNNLPAQLTTFIGREEEIAEIEKELESHRLVTLTGPGGIGKTRLSQQVAAHLLERFPDGVWFVELAPLTDPDLTPQTIHTTLGLVEQPGRTIQQMLVDFLREKKTLLILDNCEHLVEACAQLTHTLLGHSPSLKILASSREALGVEGELAWPVPSLSLPDPRKITDFDQLTQYEAVHLFLDRASLANPHFLMTEDNAPAIAQICYRLDGIPLAIELAAARIRGLSVEQIASRLDDRFHLLTSGARTVLPRHQTLHALIDWSHDLLSESERALLRRLSVFAGGWTLEAAESVCAGDSLESDQILDLLLRLVDKSLVVAKTQGAESRYHMLETIRQYAREKLWAAGEGERLRQRHLAYFVDLAERAEPNLRAFDMVMWLDRLEDELENIRLALAWSLESNIEAQLRLAGALLWFCHIRGHRNEGIDWWERGLSIETAERADQPLTLSRALLRGKALNAIGLEITMSQDSDRAKTYLEESVALFQELGATGKQGMAYALTWLGEFDSQSQRIQEQNLTFFREIGDKFSAADCLLFLSQQARNNNEYERARTLAEEQLALRREIGDHDGAATALFQLGHSAFWQQDFRRAILLFEEGLSLYRAVGNKWALGVGLSNLGDVFLWQRNYEQATKIYEEALAFAPDISDSFLIAFHSYNLGAIAWFQGDYARVNQMIAESLAVFSDHHQDWLTASCMHTLGEIALAQGDEQRAMQWYEAELAFGQKKQLEISRLFAISGLGKVAWVQGNDELATKRFEEALRMSEKAGSKTANLLALYGLGRVALSQRDYPSAGEFFTQASRIGLPEANELFNWISLKPYGVATAYPLEAFAVLAAAQNQMERAARLLGAAESLYASMHFEVSAKERAEHDHAITSARAALSEKAFAAAWAEGHMMTMEQAIAFSSE